MLYFGDFTVGHHPFQTTAMLITIPNNILYYKVYSGEPQPSMYFDAVRFLNGYALEMKQKTQHSQKYMLLTDSTPTYCDQPLQADSQNIQEILTNCGMKQYYIPLESQDLNPAA